jgi:hypothetical protein
MSSARKIMTLGGCSRREGSAKQKQGMDKEMKSNP